MYPTKLQPSDSGPGTYRFLVGSAVLACQESLAEERKFHTHMEWLIALAEPVLALKQKEWNDFMLSALVDETGAPLPEGSAVPLMVRYRQLGYIMRELREAGIFGSKTQETDNESKALFDKVLAERGHRRPKEIVHMEDA